MIYTYTQDTQTTQIHNILNMHKIHSIHNTNNDDKLLTKKFIINNVLGDISNVENKKML